MDVVSRRWVWVESMGVASGCRCKEIYRFPHITYPYLSLLLLYLFFLAAASLLFVHFLKCFSFLFLYFFVKFYVLNNFFTHYKPVLSSLTLPT